MKIFKPTALTFIAAFLFGIAVFAGTPVKVIVLDAGHGGKDPGAVGYSGSHEKTINLAIVLKAEKLFNERYPEIKVLQTRASDMFVELNSRVAFANKNRADLFISVHCNSANVASASGTEVYLMGLEKGNANLNVAKTENSAILYEKNYENNYEGFDPSSPEAYIIFSLYQNAHLKQSIQLASLLAQEFKQIRRIDRGVRQAPFLVLWKTTMPSVLVEVGFISNQGEEAYLASEKGQDEIAAVIVAAVGRMIEEGKEPSAQTVKKDTVKEKTTGLVVQNASTETNIKPSQPQPPSTPTTQPPSNTSPPKSSQPSVSSQPAIEMPSKPSKPTGVVYRIQFFSSKIKFETTDKRFHSLTNIEYTFNGEYHRYTSGKFDTYDEAIAHQAKVRRSGFSDAFIVAREGDTIISVAKAKEIERKNKQ